MAGSIDVSVRNAAPIRPFAASPSVRKHRACWPARRRHLSISSIEEFRLRNAAMAPALQKLYASSTDPLFRRGGNSFFDAMEKLRAIEAKIRRARRAIRWEDWAWD